MTGIKIKQKARLEWEQQIRDDKSKYSQKFAAQPKNKILIPKNIKRSTASAYFQLKIGHGYNRQYLERFHKMDSPLCSCGSIQSPEHLILSCKWYRKERKKLKEALNVSTLSLRRLLCTKTGIEAIIAYIDQTKISTRTWHMGSLAEDAEESEAEWQTIQYNTIWGRY
ncbi:hypothetical protein K402DRAFT_428690, partial [Aulographum hederae CBS 113979]